MDEMREAFERAEAHLQWLKESAFDEQDLSRIVGYERCLREWQAATASADAKYLPVIEKLVEALAGEQRLREIIRNADPRVEDYHAYQPTDNETHNALALAAPLLGKKEEV